MKKRNLNQQKWKQKLLTLGMTFILAATMLVGCGNVTVSFGSSKGETQPEDNVTVRIGSLKGPTSMGLLPLKEKAEASESQGQYEFTMATGADELLPLVVKGDIDIALVPANVASVLYNQTEGGISVIDINTLGVLYMVSSDSSISSVESLKGKTIYLTGKGTTPDYVLQYILTENGMANDCTLEYKSEATEVAALLSENPEAIGLLPQPFVTVACAQNETLAIVLDMNDEWTKLQDEDGSRLVTGVTIVRKGFLEEHKGAVTTFLEEHKTSAEAINSDVEKGAELVVAAGIVPKAPIAQKAIPSCNITYIDGEEMQQALEGYLNVLYNQNPKSIGGTLPAADFYYVP